MGRTSPILDNASIRLIFKLSLLFLMSLADIAFPCVPRCLAMLCLRHAFGSANSDDSWPVFWFLSCLVLSLSCFGFWTWIIRSWFFPITPRHKYFPKKDYFYTSMRICSYIWAKYTSHMSKHKLIWATYMLIYEQPICSYEHRRLLKFMIFTCLLICGK